MKSLSTYFLKILLINKQTNKHDEKKKQLKKDFKPK